MPIDTVFGEKETEISIKVGSSAIKESKEEKLLGVVIDQKLNVKEHVNMYVRRQARSYVLLHVL